uniref:Mp36-like protein n=1 Tax=Cavenderia fasciculata TaxID=261658 RepID=B2XXA5_CACFS|nr:Mp36-like protein [Cavenderia fasciculata]ABX45227.1 Mp36-like protein [Cavenderia fasciculata]
MNKNIIDFNKKRKSEKKNNKNSYAGIFKKSQKAIKKVWIFKSNILKVNENLKKIFKQVKQEKLKKNIEFITQGSLLSPKLYYIKSKKRKKKLKRILKYFYKNKILKSCHNRFGLKISFFRYAFLKKLKRKHYFKKLRFRRNSQLQRGRRRKILKKLKKIKKNVSSNRKRKRIFKKYKKKLNKVKKKVKLKKRNFKKPTFISNLKVVHINEGKAHVAANALIADYKMNYIKRINYFAQERIYVQNNIKVKLHIQRAYDIRRRLMKILIRFNEIWKRLRKFLKKFLKMHLIILKSRRARKSYEKKTQKRFKFLFIKITRKKRLRKSKKLEKKNRKFKKKLTYNLTNASLLKLNLIIARKEKQIRKLKYHYIKVKSRKKTLKSKKRYRMLRFLKKQCFNLRRYMFMKIKSDAKILLANWRRSQSKVKTKKLGQIDYKKWKAINKKRKKNRYVKKIIGLKARRKFYIKSYAFNKWRRRQRNFLKRTQLSAIFKSMGIQRKVKKQQRKQRKKLKRLKRKLQKLKKLKRLRRNIKSKKKRRIKRMKSGVLSRYKRIVNKFLTKNLFNYFNFFSTTLKITKKSRNALTISKRMYRKAVKLWRQKLRNLKKIERIKIERLKKNKVNVTKSNLLRFLNKKSDKNFNAKLLLACINRGLKRKRNKLVNLIKGTMRSTNISKNLLNFNYALKKWNGLSNKKMNLTVAKTAKTLNLGFFKDQLFEHIMYGRKYVLNKYKYKVLSNLGANGKKKVLSISKIIAKQIKRVKKRKLKGRKKRVKLTQASKLKTITKKQKPFEKKNKFYSLTYNNNVIKNNLTNTIQLKSIDLSKIILSNYIKNKNDKKLNQMELFKLVLLILNKQHVKYPNVTNNQITTLNITNYANVVEKLNIISILNQTHMMQPLAESCNIYMIKNMLNLKWFNAQIYKRMFLRNMKKVIYTMNVSQNLQVIHSISLPKIEYLNMNKNNYVKLIKKYHKKLRIIKNLINFLYALRRKKFKMKKFGKYMKISKKLYFKIKKIKKLFKLRYKKLSIKHLKKVKRKYKYKYKKILKLFRFKYKKIKNNIIPNYASFKLKKQWLYKNLKRYIRKAKKAIIKIYKHFIKFFIKRRLKVLLRNNTFKCKLTKLTSKKQNKILKFNKFLKRYFKHKTKRLKVKLRKLIKHLKQRKKPFMRKFLRKLKLKYKQKKVQYALFRKILIKKKIKKMGRKCVAREIRKKIIILLKHLKKKFKKLLKQKVLKNVKKELKKVYKQRISIRVADQGLPKVGLFAIKLGKRNMYISIFDKKTNKLLTTMSARRAFIKQQKAAKKRDSFNDSRDKGNDADSGKARAGEEIKNSRFKKQLMFEMFFKATNLRYKIMDIRYDKKYKTRELKTVLKVPVKYAGVIRNIEINKQKAHGYMRKKKLRRL